MSADLTQPDVSCTISRLFVYPIKSCAGVEVQEAILTETGLEFDRAWMVVDEQREFLTQRELPRMALIKPQLKAYEMVLRAPGMLALHLKLDEVEAAVRVRVWDHEAAAFDMGGVAAQWLTDFLGCKVRLVRFDPDHQRLSNTVWTGKIQARNQFSDGFPLLLISEASLNNLNSKLVAAGSGAVGMERFRPNIVLGHSASLMPHDEDRLEDLQISTDQGEVQLKPVKPCLRCPIPNIDPLCATSSPQVMDMLQTYRQDVRALGALTFGMNVIAKNGWDGVDRLLRVGQPVEGSYLFE